MIFIVFLFFSISWYSFPCCCWLPTAFVSSSLCPPPNPNRSNFLGSAMACRNRGFHWVVLERDQWIRLSIRSMSALVVDPWGTLDSSYSSLYHTIRLIQGAACYFSQSDLFRKRFLCPCHFYLIWKRCKWLIKIGYFQLLLFLTFFFSVIGMFDAFPGLISFRKRNRLFFTSWNRWGI